MILTFKNNNGVDNLVNLVKFCQVVVRFFGFMNFEKSSRSTPRLEFGPMKMAPEVTSNGNTIGNLRFFLILTFIFQNEMNTTNKQTNRQKKKTKNEKKTICSTPLAEVITKLR